MKVPTAILKAILSKGKDRSLQERDLNSEETELSSGALSQILSYALEDHRPEELTSAENLGNLLSACLNQIQVERKFCPFCGGGEKSTTITTFSKRRWAAQAVCTTCGGQGPFCLGGSSVEASIQSDKSWKRRVV